MRRSRKLDHHDAFPHLMKVLCYTVAEVTQADQDNMIFHGGGDSHLPLLAACPAVEEQAAEISKTLRKNNDANHRHEKMK